MSTSPTLTTAPARSRAGSEPQGLQVLTLVVAGVAAVLSIFAITTKDAGTGTAAVAVQHPAVSQPTVIPAPRQVGAQRNLDDCGRPIVIGRFACR